MMRTRLTAGLAASAALVGLLAFPVRAEEPADADNSARNSRDREDATVTPGDQGSSEQDVKITSTIRSAVMEQDALSMNAKNVKIITQNGVVTLRGPVKSAAEKDAIRATAQRTAGVKRVDDQLEIEKE